MPAMQVKSPMVQQPFFLLEEVLPRSTVYQFKVNLFLEAGLTIDDIDIFEINEAFASQCLYSAQVRLP